MRTFTSLTWGSASLIFHTQTSTAGMSCHGQGWGGREGNIQLLLYFNIDSDAFTVLVKTWNRPYFLQGQTLNVFVCAAPDGILPTFSHYGAVFNIIWQLKTYTILTVRIQTTLTLIFYHCSCPYTLSRPVVLKLRHTLSGAALMHSI